MKRNLIFSNVIRSLTGKPLIHEFHNPLIGRPTRRTTSTSAQLRQELKVRLSHHYQIETYGQTGLYERPRIPFSRQISEVEEDTDILDSFGFLVDASVGKGFYVTAAQQTLVERINTFMEDIHADEMSWNQGFEIMTYGSSFWMPALANVLETAIIGAKNDYFVWVKLSTVLSAYMGGASEPQWYELQNRQKLAPGQVLHLTWHRSNASVFGLGKAYPLLIAKDYNTFRPDGTLETLTVPATVNMKKQMQHDALIRHHKTIGKTLLTAPEAEDDVLTSLSNDWDAPEVGKDTLVNFEVKAQELGVNRRIMDNDVKAMIDEEFIKASGNPETKLITAQGYTEASALAAIKAASLRLASFERHMSRIWEQLFIRPWYERDPELDANGVPIRWADAKIQIKWGSEERGEIDFNSFVTLIQLMQTSGYRLLTEKEIRKNLRKWDLELDSDETVGLFEEQIPKTPVPALPQEMINTLKKKGDLYDMAIEMMKRKRGVN